MFQKQSQRTNKKNPKNNRTTVVKKWKHVEQQDQGVSKVLVSRTGLLWLL